MVTLLTVIHIIVCLFLILVVLLQAGKGGGMGIAFGGGGSQTVFGSSGAGNFLTRLTSITAAIFLITSLTLAHYSSRQDSRRLQQLASERATQKKAEEEKAAKLKAELDKSRPATSAPATKDGAKDGNGAPTSGAPEAPAPTPSTSSIPARPAAPRRARGQRELARALGAAEVFQLSPEHFSQHDRRRLAGGALRNRIRHDDHRACFRATVRTLRY